MDRGATRRSIVSCYYILGNTTEAPKDTELHLDIHDMRLGKLSHGFV